MTEVTHEILYKRSGVSAHIPHGANILEFSDRVEGVSIPSLCRGGTCGTCKVRCISGAVEAEQTKGLSDAERRKGLILACASRAMGALVLDV